LNIARAYKGEKGRKREKVPLKQLGVCSPALGREQGDQLTQIQMEEGRKKKRRREKRKFVTLPILI